MHSLQFAGMHFFVKIFDMQKLKLIYHRLGAFDSADRISVAFPLFNVTKYSA